MKYQLFPNLTADEFEALSADIRERGVMVPVEVDENGDILDGHHRAMIADSFGVEYPTVVRSGWTEDQKLVHVVALNAHRRQLSATERADVVASLRKAKLSTRAIAKAVGVSKSTIDRDLSAVPNGTPDRITGTDGKSYPTVRPRLDPNPDPYFVKRAAEKAEPHPLQAAADVIAQDPKVKAAETAHHAALVLRDLTRARNAAAPDKWAELLDADDAEAFRIELNSFERWIAEWRVALDKPLRIVTGGRS